MTRPRAVPGPLHAFAWSMGIVHNAVAAVGAALAGLHADADGLAARRLKAKLPATISLRSPAFTAGGPLPVSCTADGAGEPPALEWDNVPRKAVSLVLICEDPDAPAPMPFVHWLVYAIPARARRIAPPRRPALVEARGSGREHNHNIEGRNSLLKKGYAPAAPPPGHGVHHYHFQLFALDTVSTLQPHVGREALLDHMRGHVLAWGELVGTYQRD